MEKKKKRGRRGGKNKDDFKKIKTEHVVEEHVEEVQEDAIDFTASNEPEYEFGVPDKDTRDYFKGIEKMLEEDVDYSLLLENVYHEIDGKELMLATDFEASRILEKLLRSSSDFQIRVFADRLMGNYQKLFIHTYASHVCQTLLFLAADIVERETLGYSKKEDDNLPSMSEIVISIGKHLQGNWKTLVEQTQGSFLVRVYLSVLSGEALQDNEIRSNKSKKYNKKHGNFQTELKKKRSIPVAFQGMLDDVLGDILKELDTETLRRLAFEPVSNPVLQLLLSFEKSRNNNQEFINSLIQDQVGSHLMEKIVLNSNENNFKLLFNQFFKDRFLYLAKDSVGNFVVQKVIQQCYDDQDFLFMISELKSDFKDLLFGARAGIISSLFQKAIQFPSHQQELLTCLQDALQILPDDLEKLIFMCLYLISFKKYSSNLYSPTPNLHGTLIVQHILNFSPKNCKVMTDSILACDFDEIHRWVTDPMASRILDAFLDSATVAKSAKRELIKKFIESMPQLAQNKYGSHFVDKCWQAANLETKEEIAKMLLNPKLAENFHAKFVLRNCKIELYKHDKEEWLQVQKGLKKKRKNKDEIDDVFDKIQ